MKAKLIKVQDEYWLSTDKQTDFCYHLGHKEILKVTGVGEKSGEVHHEKGWNKPNEVVFIDRELSAKLSLKNCQAIENGYDLYKLAEEEYLKHENNELLYGDSEDKQLAYKAGIVDGFQKALEILSDKKFRERDIKAAIRRGYVERQVHEGVEVYFETYEEFIQSLQQNEWDVEILDERDSEGRLILKRVV